MKLSDLLIEILNFLIHFAVKMLIIIGILVVLFFAYRYLIAIHF